MMLAVTFTGIYPIQTTIAAAPTLSDPIPRNNNISVYNPRLRIYVGDSENDPLTVIFRTNATGSWETLGTYNGFRGYYGQNTSNMETKNNRYYWSVNASDGTSWRNNTYSFIAQPFVVKWRYYSYTNNNSIGPLSWDINNDGYDEIFMTGQNWTTKVGKAFCINGRDGTLIWSFSNDDIDYHSPFELGDLNNDGIPEMVISGNETFLNNGRTIALHANNGTVYWNVKQESGGKYLSIVDVEGNGYPYVYICSGDFYRGINGNGRLRKLKGTTGEVLKQTFLYRPCWGGITAADADNDGKLEIYVNERKANYDSYERVWDEENQTWVRVPISLGQLNLGMMCYDAETLDLLWYQDAVTASSHPLELIDVNNDGVLDAVSLQQNGGGVYVVDGATWDKMPGYFQDRISGLNPHSPFPLYDIDNDGKIEMIVASEGPARMWDLGEWDSYIQMGNASEPPKMANVIGDEQLEIISFSRGAKIYDPYGVLIETIPTCYGHDTPLVQDIDNDWQNEIIVLSGDGQLQCIDTSAYAPTTRVRSNVQLYSERRTGVGIYIPPPGAPQPIIKTVIPADEACDVSLNPMLRARIIDYHYDRMDITISTNASGSWVDLYSENDKGNGWYNISTTTMNEKNKTYYWRVTAVDPDGDNMVTTETYCFTTQAPPQISDVTATPSAVLPGNPVNISSNVTDGTTVSTVKINIRYPDGSIDNRTALGGNPAWTVLCYDDFESGWGSYTDGGDACFRYTGGAPYAYQGTRAIKIQNFLGLDSSFYLTNPIDVHTPRYTKIRVDFWFIAHGMSNLTNFWVKFYDGQHWRIVDNYIKPGAQGYRPTDKPFENDTFYHAITWINESKYTFPTNMKIRFECDALRDENTVYIDQIYINATTAQGEHYFINDTYSQMGTYQYYIWARDTYGNGIRSPTQTFVMSGNPPPNTPSNPSPKNNSLNIARTADLHWTGGDVDPDDTVTYDVYFGTSSTPPQVADDIASPSYDPGTLAYNTVYYWRIIAQDSNNQTTEGPLWHFTTVKEQSGGGGGGGGGGYTPEPQNQKPLANVSAGSPYEGYVNSAVLFDGSLSSDPDGNITEWYWTFGDSSNGTGKTVTHSYANIGTYNVTLRVTDNKGAINTTRTTCVITQPNRPPTEPLITGPINGTVNTIINFSAVSTDEDNDTIQYTFIWEDVPSEVTYMNISGFVASGTPVSFSHLWTIPGQYAVTVKVSDNQTESSAEILITIEAEQPAQQPTPGFEIALILSAVLLSMLLWRKKRKI